MPLTVKYSETYNDALMALAAVTQRPANIVNLGGDYAIRVDLEYNRYVIATNTKQGLSDEPDAGGSWSVRFFQVRIDGLPDELLTEASDHWLIDALDSAVASLEADGNRIGADANFSEFGRAETALTTLDELEDQDSLSTGSLN